MELEQEGIEPSQYEDELEQDTSLVSPQLWDMERLRTIRYEPTNSIIFARSKSIIQRIYRYSHDDFLELAIRRTIGLPIRTSLANLIWLNGIPAQGKDILIGVDPAYIFERTGCLVKPRMLSWNHDNIVSFVEIVMAVLNEFNALLNIEIQGFQEEVPASELDTRNYISVDHKGVSRIMVLADVATLDVLEDQARNYCTSYWDDYESMGRKIHFELGIFIYPLKRYWSDVQLSGIEEGDLIALQNFNNTEHSTMLRGALRFKGEKFDQRQYEVFLKMNEDETMVHFGSDQLDAPGNEHDDVNMAPHEQIELEVYAGKTKILFNELCSVQEGTLIELREHALPLVTLCVMGTPILEGELVHFQDQLMVQVTRRLD